MIRLAICVNKCNSGGLKSVVMSYINNFDPQRVKFDLIVDSDSNSIPYEEVKAKGGNVCVIPPYQDILKNMAAIRRLCKENRYDVFYALNNTMNLFPLFVAWRSGVKVRVSESLTTASKVEKARTLMKNVLRMLSHCFCNRMMANGVESAVYQFGEQAVKAGKVDIFLNPLNTDNYRFDPALREATRKEFGWDGKVVYGTIIRFETQKNPLFLLDVMNAIMKRRENARFCIIGAGSMEQEMKDRIAGYGFGDRMAWLGRREDIKKFYNAFDAFLLPSLYEGFPVVGVESQATGLPIFYSDAVTREASVEELAHYIPLTKSADEWAGIIVSETEAAMAGRHGRGEYLRSHGFDAKSETERLTSYFEDAVRKG